MRPFLSGLLALLIAVSPVLPGVYREGLEAAWSDIANLSEHLLASFEGNTLPNVDKSPVYLGEVFQWMAGIYTWTTNTYNDQYRFENKFGLIGVLEAKAASKFWIGPAEGSFSNNAHWSTTSGGSNNTTAPGSADVAIFDGGGTNNVVIDANINVSGIDIRSGYTGTITQNATRTITIGAGNYSQADGTFTGGNSTIDLNGTYALSGGTFTATSGTMSIGKAYSTSITETIFAQTGGTFTHNSGTISFDPLVACSRVVPMTIDLNTSLTLYNVTVTGWVCDTNNGINVSSGDTLIVANNFTHTSFSADAHALGGNWEVRGNIIADYTASNRGANGSAIITLNGTGDQTYTFSGGDTITTNLQADALPALVINKPSGTVAPASGTTELVVKSLTLTQGSFTAPTGNLTLMGSFSTTKTDLSVAAGASFTHNSGTIELTGGSSCGTSTTRTIDVDGSLTVNSVSMNVQFCDGNHTWAAASGDTLVLAGNLTQHNGLLAGTWQIQGNVTINSGADGGTATLSFTDTNNQTYTDNGGNEVDGDITINKSSGTVTLTSNADWNATNQDVTTTDGTLDLAGNTIATNTLTVTDTLQLRGNETITAMTKTLSSGSTVIFTGDGDSATDTYTFTDKFTDYHHLTINSTDGNSDTFRTNSNITVAGNLTNTAGTFDATTNSNTVTLDGTNQTLTGSTIFYNLSKTESADDSTDETLTFTAGTTTTITNTWTLDGRDSGDRINLVSSSPGTTWSINPQSTRTLDNIEVTDSVNTNSTVINEYTDSTLVSGGNNTGWIFSTNSAFTWMGTTNSNWSTGSNWLGGAAPSSSQVAVFDGSSDVNATIDANINVSGIDINTGYDGIITQASTRTVTVGVGNYDQASGTFAGGDSTIDMNSAAFTLSGGTFTSTSGTWTHQGNFTISGGTFNHNNGTVSFDANTNRTISAAGIVFNHLGFNVQNSSATVTISSGTYDVNGNLSFVNNTAGTSASGVTITVAGNVIGNNGSKLSVKILFDGTGDQTLSVNGGTGTLTSIEINKASGILTIQDTLNIGLWMHIAGAVDPGTSTVVVSSTTGNIDASHSFFNFTVSSGCCSTVNITGTLDVNSTFRITDGNVNGGTVLVAGDIISTDTSNAGSSPITLDGTGTQTITLAAGVTSYDLPNSTFTINKASGTAVLTTNATTAFNASGQDLTVTSGTFDLAGFDLTVNDQFTVGASGALQLEGDETITGGPDSLASGSTVIYTGSGTYASFLLGDAYHHLTLNGSGSWTLDAALDANGDLTISQGTFVSGGNSINVGGSWDTSGGTFTHGDNTVTLDGSGSGNSLLEGGSFYDLVVAGAGTWDAGDTLTVDNDLTISHSSGVLDLNGNDLNLTRAFSNVGTLRLAGAETLTGFVNDTDSGTIAYDGGSGATGLIAGTDYNGLSFSGAGTWDPVTDLTISGNFLNTATLSNLASRIFTLDGETQTFTPGGLSLGTLLLTGGSGTVSVGGDFSVSSLLSIAAGRVLSLISHMLTAAGDITNLGTLTESSGAVIHAATNFYIADNSFDQDAAISLGVDKVYLTIVDQDGNVNGSSADTISSAVVVTCPNGANSDDSETVSLTETGNATEVFRYTTGITTAAYDGSVTANDGTLECTDGDTITATYTDPQDGSDTEVDTTVATGDTIPTAPSGFSGTANSPTAITWSWTDNAANETGFKLYDSSNVLIATIVGPGSGSGATVTYQETGLTAATSYTRKLVAYNTAGNSSFSNSDSETTQAASPTAPSNFAGTAASASSIIWTWTDNSTNETSWILQNSSGSTVATISSTTGGASGGAISYTETGLSAGTSYTRKMAASNSNGTSAATSTVTVTTNSANAPTAPDLRSPANEAILSSIYPTFTFTRASDNDDAVASYTLLITKVGGSTETLSFASPRPGSLLQLSRATVTATEETISVSITDGEMLESADYTWKARATDEADNTTDSATGTFTIEVSSSDLKEEASAKSPGTSTSAAGSGGETPLTAELATSPLSITEVITRIAQGETPTRGPESLQLEELGKEARLRMEKQSENLFAFLQRFVSHAFLERFDQGLDRAMLAARAQINSMIYQSTTRLAALVGLGREQLVALSDILYSGASSLTAERERLTEDINSRLTNVTTEQATRLTSVIVELRQNIASQVQVPDTDVVAQLRQEVPNISPSDLETAQDLIKTTLETTSDSVVNQRELALSRLSGLSRLTGQVIISAQEASVVAYDLLVAGRSNRLELARGNEERLDAAIEPVRIALGTVRTRSELAYDALFGRFDYPLAISDVTIENLEADRVVISWKTSRRTIGKVNYGPSLAYGADGKGGEAHSEELALTHTVEIPDLDPNTRIFFEVVVTDTKNNSAADAYYSFTTPNKE